MEYLLDFLGRGRIPEEVVLKEGHVLEVKLAMVRDEPTVVPFSGGTLRLGWASTPASLAIDRTSAESRA